ncbi:hypothetical protein DSECCO2_613860 [anaerobic digester metagenome]
MVGVGEGPLADAPGPFPLQGLVVDQQAHEFGDADGRVRVVELHGHLVREAVEGGVVVLAEAAQDVLEGRGHEEILLPQAQLLAAGALVVGIEYLGDVLALGLGLDRADVVAAVEDLQLEIAGGDGLPQTHVGHVAVQVPRDHDVAGHGHDRFRVDPAEPLQPGAVLIDLAAPVKVNAIHEVYAAKDPR